MIWSLGPVSLLVEGRVWALDLGGYGVFGIGRRIHFRRVRS